MICWTMRIKLMRYRFSEEELGAVIVCLKYNIQDRNNVFSPLVIWYQEPCAKAHDRFLFLTDRKIRFRISKFKQKVLKTDFFISKIKYILNFTHLILKGAK